MKLKQVLSLILLCMSVVSPAGATSKKKTHFKLVTAYTRKIDESKQTNPPMAGYFFVIKWEGDSYPETFFWRGDNGWLTCNIEKAIKGKNSYIGKPIEISKIKKGDVLLLTPLTGGRFPVPTKIPEKAKNTLFYKVGGSGWLDFPVKKVSKK